MKQWIAGLIAFLMTLPMLPGAAVFAEDKAAENTVYEINVAKETQQTVKGWGVYPSSVGPTWLSKSAAHKAIYKDLGISQYRIELRGQAGDADGNIVQSSYGDFVSTIQLAKNYGVTRYSVHVWSPPPGMKDNNNISGFRDDGKQAKLLESKEQLFCDWVVRCFDGLKERNLPLPIAFSFSNEPDVVKEYQSCGYEMDQYIRVAKMMRKTLDAGGYSDITLLAPEGGGYITNKRWIGENASALDEDEEYRNAIGAFATHSYPYRQGTPDSAIVDFVAACDKYPEKDRWQTELCNGNSWGKTQVDRAMITLGTLNSDMEWGRMNYWLWWIGFDTRYSIDAEYQESLLGGDGVTYVTPSAHYLVLQKLYKSAYAGSKVKKVTSTDPEMKTNFALVNHLSAYVNQDHTVVMMINNSDQDKTYRVTGLTGKSAVVNTVSNSFEGMREIANANLKDGVLEQITLPAKSISVLSSNQKDTAPPALSLELSHEFMLDDGSYVLREREATLTGGVDEATELKINHAKVKLDDDNRFSYDFYMDGKEKTLKITGYDPNENYLKPVYLKYTYQPSYVGVRLLNLTEKTNLADFPLRGKTNTPATVTVNGVSVETDADNAFSVTVPLEEGENTLRVSAADKSGNRAAETEYAVFCDSKPPIVQAEVISPFTNDAECVIAGTVSEAAESFTVQGKDVPLEDDLSFVAKAVLKEGTNQIPIVARDLYGNEVTKTVTAEFRPDEDTAHPTDAVTYSAKATGRMVMDGRLSEEDWKIDNKAVKLSVGSYANNIVNFGTLWDENNLYVAAKVVDKSLVFDQEAVYNNDCIEIFLNPGNEKISMYMPNDKQLFIGYQQGKKAAYQNAKKYELGWVDTDYGYTAEMAIPWSDLGITPAEGVKIGFDLSCDDNDGHGKRDSVIMWSGTNENWHDTSNFGTLYLTTRDKVTYQDKDISAPQQETQQETESDAVRVTLNGTEIVYEDAKPVLMGDYVLAPVRKTAEMLGATVTWDAETHTATFVSDAHTAVLKEDSSEAIVDGETVTLPTAAVTQQDRILVPLRFLSEAFDAEVSWDEARQTVVIVK